MQYHSIAIDGPSGAGKSTIAKQLAKELGFVYVDTGAMYRTIGLFAAQQGVDPADPDGVSGLLPRLSMDLAYQNGEQRMLLNGKDVSQDIRTEQASRYASQISAIPQVRGFLLEFQRGFAARNNILMDGRDIGTVVLPTAEVKIFLTASPEARAKRRYAEQISRGENVTLDAVLAAIQARDEADTTRSAAPLKAAPDAVVVDTTALSLEASVHAIQSIIKEKLYG